MQSCLKSCGDCASAKKRPGCRRTGTTKSRAPSGVPRVMLGVQTSMNPADPSCRGSTRPPCARGAGCAACCRATQVEPAVPEAERLVHALLVELERERRRARDDLELVDLELDLAGRHRRVDRLRRAGDDLPARAEDELVPDLLRRLGGLGRMLGVDDELRHAGVVAQVDEDEAAVVAPRVRPAGESQRLPDVLGAEARRTCRSRQLIATVSREARRG